MRVAGQILENLRRSTEGRFCKDNPLDFLRPPAQKFKGGRFRQTGHLSMEAQLALLKGLLQIDQKDIPEPASQYLHGKKEGLLPATDPTCAIRSNAAAWHDAVEMWMKMKVLAPGVQNGEKPDGGAQTFGIGRDSE